MDEAEFNRVKQWLAVILRGIFVIGSVFLITLFGSRYLLDHLRTKVYTATAMLQATPRAVVREGVDAIQSYEFDAETGAAEAGVITSPAILTPVVRDANLEAVWKHRLFPTRQPWSERETVEHLQKNVRVESRPGTDLLEITVRDDLPKEAADLANAVAAEYKLKRDSEDVERANAAKDAINQQIDQQQQVIETKKAVLDQLKDRSSRVIIQPGLVPPDSDDTPDLAEYHAAQRDFDRQKALLDLFTLHLRQVMDAAQSTRSAVRIVAPAKVPESVSQPNRKFDQKITLVAAILLSLGIGSSVEIVFLLLRAAKRPENY